MYKLLAGSGPNVGGEAEWPLIAYLKEHNNGNILLTSGVFFGGGLSVSR